MKLVQIEPGSFTMGSADGEWDERPMHRVTISRPFRVATTEVTNAQFEKFDPTHRKYRGTRGVSNEDDEAVVYVSWHEAVAFCEWLTKKEGKPYRLPTEAEWEYACRAGATTTFHTGDVLPEVFHRNQPVEGDWATERFKKDGDLRAKKGKVPVSLRVGSMPANAFGLHEMHGNVEEWCFDWYGEYPTSTKSDDPVGPADGLFKVSRGGSHNTYARHLRSANRHGTVPEDKHWLIGFRVVQAPPLKAGARGRAYNTLDDGTVSTLRAEWDKPIDRPLFLKPIPFVIRDDDHPHLADLSHHHCPSITWCDNGDLVAAWFNTRSELGREMVTLTSRLRHGLKEWDKSRIFFAPADRNTTGVNLVNDGAGRLYFFNAIAESSHHRDQCLVMSTSENSGREWTRPRIISNLDDRHKYTPMDAAFVDRGGSLVVAMDYAPIGHSANECGSGVFISPDRGQTWLDRVSGKVAPEVGQGMNDGLIAGFHPGIVKLGDRRLMAFARTGNIDKRMTKSVSRDMGKTWTYQRSEFPPIGGGQRLVLMRLREGPILLISFTDSRRREGMTFTDDGGRDFAGYGIFAALSFDEGDTWPAKKPLTAGGPPREVDGGGNTHEFTMDDTHAEPAGYLASTQTPDGMIHLISSRWHYRFNLAWLKTPSQLPTQR